MTSTWTNRLAWALGLVIALSGGHARAERIFVVVTERSAPDVIEGATRLRARADGRHDVAVRTREQVREASDAALRAGMADARA